MQREKFTTINGGEIMKAITINWNPNKDETTMKVSDELGGIARLDVLKDSIGLLIEEYNKSLAGEFHETN